jgi:hypothetical protein
MRKCLCVSISILHYYELPFDIIYRKIENSQLQFLLEMDELRYHTTPPLGSGGGTSAEEAREILNNQRWRPTF